MMFYRYEGGAIVGGPYNCDQGFAVREMADNHPDVVDFNARSEAALAAASAQPTISDILAALPQASQDAVAAKVAARSETAITLGAATMAKVP